MRSAGFLWVSRRGQRSIDPVFCQVTDQPDRNSGHNGDDPQGPLCTSADIISTEGTSRWTGYLLDQRWMQSDKCKLGKYAAMIGNSVSDHFIGSKF
jgi:hypothetical protein